MPEKFCYNDVNDIIAQILESHTQIFKERLLGFYVYGSLVWGDFDINTSDIDALCLLSSEITEDDLTKLHITHNELINQHKEWNNRIEVHYPSQYGLMHFREKPFIMGNISPGEPLHIIKAGIDWIDEWYCVQEYAVTITGIDKKEILPHIEKEEFIHTIRGYAKSFRARIRECKNSCYSQAYAILTICRALYTITYGEQISKPGAARFAMEFLPEYSDLINEALIWRLERDSASHNPAETYLLAEKFVDDVLNRFF